MAQHFTLLILPTLVLILGAVDDLRLRKVRNQLVVPLAVINFAGTLALSQWSHAPTLLVAAGAAFAMTLPLVLIKALGAGDLKILMAFALGTHWSAVVGVVFYSLLWGALLGLFQALLQREMGALTRGVVGIISRKNSSPEKLHKIPYTIALLFGWLTYLSLNHWQGGLL